MAGAVEELGAAEVLGGLEGLEERVIGRVAGGREEFRQLHARFRPQGRHAVVARLRRGRLVLGERAAFGLPLGEAPVEDAHALERKAVEVEVVEEVGRKVGAALVVEDDLLPLAHAPGLEALLHLGGGQFEAAEGEDVHVHRAGDVACRMQPGGRGVDQEHVLAVQVLGEPLDAHQRAAAPFRGPCGLGQDKEAGDEREQSVKQALRHVFLPKVMRNAGIVLLRAYRREGGSLQWAR